MVAIALATKSTSLNNRVIRFIGSDESVDRDGDTISIDGWDVSAYMKNPVVLYGHDYYALPIGKTISVTADKRARQLLFDIQFPTIEELSSNPDTPSDHALRVDAIYNMAKAGLLNTVSVGFRGIDYEATSTGRAYKRQELMEISIVPVPANPNAVAILRSAGASDSVIKGVTMQVTKGNKRLSKESQSYISERVASLSKACDELKAFIADDEEQGEEGDKGTGSPNVGGEIGADVNEPQPEKQYIIEIVEKNPTDSNKEGA
jgi:HK97 family phage prohead protease